MKKKTGKINVTAQGVEGVKEGEKGAQWGLAAGGERKASDWEL